MNDFLQLYDRTEFTYWSISVAGVAILLFAAFVSSAKRRHTSSTEATGESFAQRIWFFLAVAFALLAGRWPYLLFRSYFNPDESQQIAGAITLVHRPWFWLAVDGHTAGPMDFYYLCIPASWRGAINYTSARAEELLLVLGILYFCYRIFRLQLSASTSRKAILPLVFFFAWVTDSDFVEISTEHMPVFLITAGAYFFFLPILTRRDESSQRKDWLIAGFFLGLAPWAKLQSAVTAVAGLIVLIGWCISRTKPFSVGKLLRNVWPFCVGLGLPVLFFGALMLATHQVETFYRSYLAANLDYTYRGTAKFYLLSELWFFACESGFFPLLFLGACAWTTLYWLRIRNRKNHGAGCVKWFLGYVLISFLTVISPGRPFLHYLLFMVPSLGLLAGYAWAESFSSKSESLESAWTTIGRQRSGALFVFGWLICFLLARSLFNVPFAGFLAREWHRPLSRPAASARRYLKDGDSIALWGWRPDVYVELQAPQAVRSAHTQREIEDTPFRPYYRVRYIADLEALHPAA
ncbi:MAG TPA: glycosyltransferase family 39 protein, partial [Opitutaceae bacterium]